MDRDKIKVKINQVMETTVIIAKVTLEGQMSSTQE